MSKWRYQALSLAGAAFVALTLSACGSAGPPPQVYVLGDGVPVRPVSASQLNDPIVDLEPVRVPDYLDTTDIVTRQAGGLIVASQSARWGERLSIGVTRAIGISLRTRLPQLAVTTSPTSGDARWQILVDVDAFEVQPDGRCTLSGRWSIWEAHDGKELKEERFLFATPLRTTSDPEVVAAMTSQLAQLTNGIAAALETVKAR